MNYPAPLKTILLLLLCIQSSVIFAQNAPPWQWGKVFFGTSVNVMTNDANGNVYIGGNINDSVVINSNKLATKPGGIYVAKYSASGAFLWVKGYGNNLPSLVLKGMKTDKPGNIYLVGDSHASSIGADSLMGFGDWDVFIAKLNANGDVLWARSAGGPGSDVLYTGLGVDKDGAAYISGHHDDTINFGTIGLPAGQSSSIFIAKYDKDGNAIWAKSYDGAGQDGAIGVDADDEGNVYNTGFFETSINFGTTLLNTSGIGCFSSKHDKDGNLIWAKAISSNSSSMGLSIATDKAGGVCITGKFSGTSDFGITTLTAEKGNDAFVMKYDKDGNALWAKAISGGPNASFDEGSLVFVDNADDVYICGRANSGFINKYNSVGQALWSKNDFTQSMGSLSTMEMSVTSDGFVYLGAGYNNTINVNNTTYTQTDGNTVIAKMDKFPAGLPDAVANVHDFEIYPNPAQHSLTIRNDKPYESLSLYDVTGKLLYSKPVTGYKKERDLSIGHLIPGIYFIQLSGKEGNMHARFIKE